MALNFWYAVHRPGGPRLGSLVSISKAYHYLLSKCFEGPALSSKSPASKEAKEAQDPDIIDEKRGTDPV